MTKAEKYTAVEVLKEKFEQSSFFYITDSSTMTVEEVNNLRRKFYESGVEMQVVKNTLAKKALESISETGYQDLYSALKGPTAILFTETANLPAKVIKEFRGAKGERPIVKAAYIDSSIFLGDDQLGALASLKSKEELIGEVIGLLQSPIKNVLGALQSGGNTISGLLKALEQRGE